MRWYDTYKVNLLPSILVLTDAKVLQVHKNSNKVKHLTLQNTILEDLRLYSCKDKSQWPFQITVSPKKLWMRPWTKRLSNQRERTSLNFASKIKWISANKLTSINPEFIRKPEVFWWFQGRYKLIHSLKLAYYFKRNLERCLSYNEISVKR